MKNFLITAFVLGLAAAGCGREHATSPVPQWHSWDQVVLAETRTEAGGPVSEIIVRSDGALTLVVRSEDVARPGETLSSQGVLSTDSMEALTQLIDALPASSYLAEDPCAAGWFVITVASGGKERTFSFGSCDTTTRAVPEAARLLQQFLVEVNKSTQTPRPVVVPFQVLLCGTQSALHRPIRAVLQDRDALARLLREHAPDRPVAVPQIDFSRQVVIAEWLGDRPTFLVGAPPRDTSPTVDFRGADITPTGWFRLHFLSSPPGAACAPGTLTAQPFVLVALDRHPEEMLFEVATTEVDCALPSPIGAGR